MEQGDESIDGLVSARIFNVGKVVEALKGKILSEELSTDAGTVLKDTANTWSSTVLENGIDGRDVVFPKLDTTVVSHIEGSGSPKYTRSDYLYDDYGNVTDELDHGIVSSAADDGSSPTGDDEVFIHRDYAVNETNWILDSVSRERVRDAQGTRVSDVVRYYDGEVFNGLPFGQVDGGKVMREDRWLDTEGAYISTVRNRYDAWGNVTAILDANDGRRELFYDSDTHIHLCLLYTSDAADE